MSDYSVACLLPDTLPVTTHKGQNLSYQATVCVCVRVCVRACGRVCVCVYVRVVVRLAMRVSRCVCLACVYSCFVH